MGQIFTKLNQLVMNDVDTAADQTKPREKLETEFNTPARPFRLPDPRSATQYIDRTPIYSTFASAGSAGDTPKTANPAVSRVRYLETDLDDVLKSDNAQVANMTTSTPVPRKVIAPAPGAEEVIDSIIEQAMDQISELKFSDDVCDAMASEPSDSFVYSKQTPSQVNRAILSTPSSGSSFERVSSAEEVIVDGSVTSYAEEVVIQPEDVEQLYDIDNECAEDSLAGNWSGIGGPDRSIGTEGELSCQIPPDCSTSDILITADDSACCHQSDSLIVHNASASFELSSSMVVQSDSASICPESDSAFDLPESNVDDSMFVDSPALVYRDDKTLEINNKINLSTPQKSLLANKNGPRTPLGNVSKNSPLIGQLQPKQLSGLDGKLWKNVHEERLKRGLDSENTPPHPTGFSSYPPEVVQSAPGKLRVKNVKKSGTKWANDSLVI